MVINQQETGVSSRRENYWNLSTEEQERPNVAQHRIRLE